MKGGISVGAKELAVLLDGVVLARTEALTTGGCGCFTGRDALAERLSAAYSALKRQREDRANQTLLLQSLEGRLNAARMRTHELQETLYREERQFLRDAQRQHAGREKRWRSAEERDLRRLGELRSLFVWAEAATKKQRSHKLDGSWSSSLLSDMMMAPSQSPNLRTKRKKQKKKQKQKITKKKKKEEEPEQQQQQEEEEDNYDLDLLMMKKENNPPEQQQQQQQEEEEEDNYDLDLLMMSLDDDDDVSAEVPGFTTTHEEVIIPESTAPARPAKQLLSPTPPPPSGGGRRKPFSGASTSARRFIAEEKEGHEIGKGVLSYEEQPPRTWPLKLRFSTTKCLVTIRAHPARPIVQVLTVDVAAEGHEDVLAGESLIIRGAPDILLLLGDKTKRSYAAALLASDDDNNSHDRAFDRACAEDIAAKIIHDGTRLKTSDTLGRHPHDTSPHHGGSGKEEYDDLRKRPSSC